MRDEEIERLIAELEALAGPERERESERRATPLRCEYERALGNARKKQEVARRLLAALGPKRYLDKCRILHALDRSPHCYELDGEHVHTCGMMDRLGHVPEYLFAMGDAVRGVIGRLPAGRISGIRVYGVGGSATPAAVAREIVENSGCLGFEFEVVRRDSPRFRAVDPEALLVFASYSGDTEEVLNAFRLAKRRCGQATARMLAMSAGGKLKCLACEHGVPWIRIPRRVCQPRESLVLQTVALLHAISGLELPASPQSRERFRLEATTLEATRVSVERLTEQVKWDRPFEENEAKRIAARLLCEEGDWWDAPDDKLPESYPLLPVVLSSASNAAVAYELYTQLCEASKVLCHVAAYPEAFHNLVESMKFSLLARGRANWSLYFMESRDDEPRVAQRWQRTLSEVFEGLAYCRYTIGGETAFERSITAYVFNAWVRLYAAFLNGAEPLPVRTMSYMKDHMALVERPCSCEEDRNMG